MWYLRKRGEEKEKERKKEEKKGKGKGKGKIPLPREGRPLSCGSFDVLCLIFVISSLLLL